MNLFLLAVPCFAVTGTWREECVTMRCGAEIGLKEFNLSVSGSEKRHHLENVVVKITVNMADKSGRKWM